MNDLVQHAAAVLALDLRQYLSLQLDRPLAEVVGTARLIEDLGMDSLELADVLVMLEIRHNVCLPMEAISRLDTVNALVGEASACLPPRR